MSGDQAVHAPYDYSGSIFDCICGWKEPDTGDESVRWQAYVRHANVSSTQIIAEWEVTRWWRVCSADGRVWAESSSETEVRAAAAEIGQPVQRLWREVPRSEWRTTT